MLVLMCFTEEMKMFTRANKEEHFTFCWTLFIILLLLNNVVGLTLAMTVGWEVGLGVGLGLFPLDYVGLGKLRTYLIIKHSVLHQFLWDTYTKRHYLIAKEMNHLRVFRKVTFLPVLSV